MKIIDEKGKLLGKINIIDFLVIVFLLSLTPVFYFGYKVSYQKPPVETEKEKDLIDITCKFDFINLKPDILRLISVGDNEKDKDGRVIAEIIQIFEPATQVYEFNIGGSEKLTKEDLLLKHISVVLHLRAEHRGDTLYYKDKKIFLNYPIDFVTDKYKVEAIFRLR